jgi:cell division protein FtsL
MKRIRKALYQLVVAVALVVLAVGTVFIAKELKRLNDAIEHIRSEIPMSMLGN